MYVQTIQKRQNILIASPEETSYLNGWINKKDLKKLVKKLPLNEYRKYLENI